MTTESCMQQRNTWISEEEAAENGYKITIDPGHSSVAAEGTDPIGPGASEQKAKDSSGTTGCVTGIREYELNLQVSQKLKEELESRGYQVCMTRESNDVPVGNVERASVANNSGSDILVRIHANGSEDSSISGGMTICPTAENPYIGSLYEGQPPSVRLHPAAPALGNGQIRGMGLGDRHHDRKQLEPGSRNYRGAGIYD